MSASAYPLTWPASMPRAKTRERGAVPLIRQSDHERIVADLRERLQAAHHALECVRHQAGIWKQEARTQKATVDGVGAALGGVPDWGPIVAGVEAMSERLRAAEQVIQQCAGIMRGDGVSDQGEAYDETLRLLEAAMQESKQ